MKTVFRIYNVSNFDLATVTAEKAERWNCPEYTGTKGECMAWMKACYACGNRTPRMVVRIAEEGVTEVLRNF